MIKFFKEFIFINKSSDKLMNLAIYLLIVFGLICSTSANIAAKSTINSVISSAVKYSLFLLLAIIAYHFLSNWYKREFLTDRNLKILTIFEILLLGLALLCCYVISGPINGNYSWIWFSGVPVSIQPSEFAKPLMILIVAGYLGDKNFRSVKTREAMLWPTVIFVAIVAIILLLMGDMGTAIVLVGITFICFWVPKNKKLAGPQIFTFVATFVVIVAAVVIMLVPDIWDSLPSSIAGRFEAVTNPSRYSDSTREIYYSLLSISQGDLFGVGLGNSVQKFGYIASSDADYIFAIIVEETGIIGIAVIFGCYAIILYRLLSYGFKMRRESDAIVLIGTAAFLFIHFFLNIGGVSGLIPLTGVPLLLVSRGGSSALATMIALGMSQGVIGRYNSDRKKNKDLIKNR